LQNFTATLAVLPLPGNALKMHEKGIDPDLLIRMLLVGYCLGIRSKRRLCEEVHLTLAYRWFCRLDLADPGWGIWEAYYSNFGINAAQIKDTRQIGNYVTLLERTAAGEGMALGWSNEIETYIDRGRLVCPYSEPFLTGRKVCAVKNPSSSKRNVVEAKTDRLSSDPEKSY